MESNPRDYGEQCRFDAFCKKVLRNEARACLRNMKRQREREALFSDLSQAELDKLDTCVAIIKNAKSEKYGKKDIIKIEGVMNIDLDVLGFIDDNATVCTIVNGKLQSKKKPPLPQRLVNIVSCKNPRCITSVEDVDQVFTLCDEKAHRYRCIYCEQEYKK